MGKAQPDEGDPPRKRGRPRAGGGQGRGDNVHLRCSPSWRDWLTRFAVAEGVNVSDLLAAAAEVYSRSRRFAPPPER